MDHVLVSNERHARRLLAEYLTYYHQDRTHYALAKAPPLCRSVAERPSPQSKVTDYGVALLSQEDTALHHARSPKRSGSLLRGSLAITTTGLPPVSHQNLSRRTIRRLDRRPEIDSSQDHCVSRAKENIVAS